MVKGTIVAIDLAKLKFTVHAALSDGTPILTKNSIYKSSVLKTIANISDIKMIAMEACSSSGYWGRKFQDIGYNVKLIAPQHVRPYVKGANKNDTNDARAIAEAASRKHMKFVAVKSAEQQSLSLMVTTREALVRDRVEITNRIRACLFEYGFTVAKGDKHLLEFLATNYPEVSTQIPELAKVVIESELQRLHLLKDQLKQFDNILEKYVRDNETCQKLTKIPGIGSVTATVLMAKVGNASTFKNGREFSAWLGLTPRQNSTGGKTALRSITKHGDKMLRCLLIHGARACLSAEKRFSKSRADDQLRWAMKLYEKRGCNKAAVALANKTARIVFSILKRDKEYTPHYSKKNVC